MLTFSRAYSAPDGLAAVFDVFTSLCKETLSPLSSVLISASHEELSRFRIRPEDYSSSTNFREDYLLVSILSKWKGLDTGIDTKAVALSAFEKQEEICARVNKRLRSNSPSLIDPIFHRAQRTIANILGPFDLLKLRGLERWGPGASTDLKRSSAYLDTKMTKLPIPTTRSALPYLRQVIQDDLHWSFCILGDFPVGPYSLLPDNFTIVQGSTITTVPKSAKTDRTIAIEPRGNMFLQKAVGNYLRRKLRKFGVDLDDQSLNQRLASIAHTASLSTIDLSMASDSMTEELIYELLPVDWALYLNDLRSRNYSFDGKTFRRFEKFSSMGNGFTFELESMIFFAITEACRSDDSSPIAVYGDDIICHRNDAHVLISALSYAGFETNLDKTYVEGRFFESCGRHYFDGDDVTPFYQKEIVRDYSEHVRFINKLARYLVRQVTDDASPLSDVTGFKTWISVIGGGNIGQWTPTIPLGTEGDDGYLVPSSVYTPSREDRTRGYQWKVTKREVDCIPGDDAALLAYTLRQNSDRPEPNFISELRAVNKSSGRLAVDLESRSSKARLSMTTRWINPSWEYFLY